MLSHNSTLTTRKTSPSQLKGIILLVGMLIAAGAGFALKPNQSLVEQQEPINLETIIPKQIGDWKMDDGLLPLLASPDKQTLIDKLYSQTLSRTYVNGYGERIMLSIAYGSNQSDGLQVHKPDLCYPAQGFQITKKSSDILATDFGRIPVKRLLAVQETRVEPVTYWITIGDTLAANALQWKLAQIKYGLTGKIPDGLIFRISSLGSEAIAYPLQEEFVKLLLRDLPPKSRSRLIGAPTNEAKQIPH